MDKVIMKGSTDILSDKKVLQLITVIAFFCNSLKHARTGFSQNLQKNTKPSMCCLYTDKVCFRSFRKVWCLYTDKVCSPSFRKVCWLYTYVCMLAQYFHLAPCVSFSRVKKTLIKFLTSLVGLFFAPSTAMSNCHILALGWTCVLCSVEIVIYSNTKNDLYYFALPYKLG